MKRLGLLVAVLTVVAVATASATMTLDLGPTFNWFGNSQVTGTDNTVKIAFDLDKSAQVGIRMEQQNLVITSAGNTKLTNNMNNQITALTLDKKVASVTEELPVTIGFELGSVNMNNNNVAALNQIAPLAGVNAGIKYEVTGKVVTTAIGVNIGYRWVSINQVAQPTGNVTDNPLKDLNGLRLDVGLSVSF